MPKGPLTHRYPADASLVVCSLIPYLALTAAVFPLLHLISHSTGLSMQTLDITVAVSTGAYTMGTVLAAQFAVHLPVRRLLIVYEAMLLVSSVLAAWAPTGPAFMAGFIVQGLSTSLLLIAAVPPLVTQWPSKKMPVTGGIMNLCIFGAVAVGPTVGALEASAGIWRPLFWAVAAVAAMALLLSVLTFEDQPPADPQSPWDFVAVGLAVVGSAAAFYGAGQLQATDLANLTSLGPLIGGAILLLTLVVYEYRATNPLMPVRAAASTAPVVGIYLALTSSASAFGIMELTLGSLKKTTTAFDTGLLFLPEFGAAILIAGVFMLVFSTRFVPVLAMSGQLALIGGAALLVAVLHGGGPAVAAGTGLVGLAVAATVSPGLFMAGFSMRAALLQRVFAMIELMRGVTAFLIAPILVYLSTVLGSNKAAGTTWALWICVGIAALGFIGGLGLYLSGFRRLQKPNLARWQEQGETAWVSPPLLDRLRGGSRAPATSPEALSPRRFG
ncbi:MAG: MFS transporter [Solirubrobacteraceae bacterium]